MPKLYQFAEFIVVTDGGHGVGNVHRGSTTVINAPRATVLTSTVSAGDATLAGMLYAMLCPEQELEPVRFGACCGTVSCTKANKGILSLSEVLMLYNK